MSQIIDTRSKIISILLTLLGSAIGFFIHFGQMLTDMRHHIFGDNGDGFFNLWVMHHNSIHYKALNLASILDGKIFFPDNQFSLLWSDSLFLPSVFYTFFGLFTDSRFVAYNLTAFFLTLLWTVFCWGLFHAVYVIAKERFAGLPAWSYYLVPFVTYLATFSSGHTLYYMHFQNLSAAWVVGILAFTVAFLQKPNQWRFAGIIACFVAVNYSSQYFAVMSVILLVFWALYYLSVYGLKGAMTFVKTYYLPIALGIIFIAPVGYLYFSVHSSDFVLGVRPGRGISHLDLFRPYNDTTLYKLLKSNNLVHYWAGHERPAYLGWGLILAIVSLLSIKFWYVRTAVVDDFKKRYWPALLLLGSTVAVLSFGKDWGYWGMVLVMFAMAQFLFFLSAHIRYRDWSVPIGFLLLCLLPIYGMADGPRGGANPVDVSVWGVFQNLVPGVSKMRAMGRMAPLGLIVLFALTFYGYFALVSAIAKRRKLLVFNCFFLTMLSFAIWEHTSAVYIFKYQEESIRPSPSAEVFFSNKSYKILSLPLHPWHVTTYAMNYFVESPEILLMNGYSGKMNELLKQLMDKESVGFMNLDTFSLAKENQAELVVVFKELLNDKQSQKLESLSPIIQFQDDKIAAIDINALLENEQAFGVGEK